MDGLAGDTIGDWGRVWVPRRRCLQVADEPLKPPTLRLPVVSEVQAVLLRGGLKLQDGALGCLGQVAFWPSLRSRALEVMNFCFGWRGPGPGRRLGAGLGLRRGSTSSARPGRGGLRIHLRRNRQTKNSANQDRCEMLDRLALWDARAPRH